MENLESEAPNASEFRCLYLGKLSGFLSTWHPSALRLACGLDGLSTVSLAVRAIYLADFCLRFTRRFIGVRFRFPLADPSIVPVIGTYLSRAPWHGEDARPTDPPRWVPLDCVLWTTWLSEPLRRFVRMPAWE